MPVSTNSETAIALAESQSVLDELVSPLATASTRHRLRIVDRITDLFAAGSRNYSHEQIALFDDVLRRLCTDIEVKARAKLAERLAGMHSAPPKLVPSFAFDDAIEVAAPVLVRSQQLTDDDLIENATTKSQDHLFAIAQRLKLSETVTCRSNTAMSAWSTGSLETRGPLFSCGLWQADQSSAVRQKADFGSRRA
jgi:uncharacterized protein (DUF2336 family)